MNIQLQRHITDSLNPGPKNRFANPVTITQTKPKMSPFLLCT